MMAKGKRNRKCNTRETKWICLLYYSPWNLIHKCCGVLTQLRGGRGYSSLPRVILQFFLKWEKGEGGIKFTAKPNYPVKLSLLFPLTDERQLSVPVSLLHLGVIHIMSKSFLCVFSDMPIFPHFAIYWLLFCIIFLGFLGCYISPFLLWWP